ncbi:nucleoside recognition domain-containing protein [Bacillus sp. 1P06AnD]|uniref:nucleoside recognition domain-containing protein n=1 Tax=Bacillus sp. 1P06AnD TaxID=3132208 RepID=UPI0039A14664
MGRISWLKGVQSGFYTTWLLGKIVFPVTFIVTALGFTPIMEKIVGLVAPVMKWFGLPGEAAVPLVLGNFLNLYAAIGGILSLDLTVKEVFIVAVMLSFAHNIFIETGVALKVGVKLWIVLLVRYGLAFLSAFAISRLWDGGSGLAQYGFAQAAARHADGFWDVIFQSIGKAASGVLQLAIIVIPLMIFIQIMKDLKWIDFISNKTDFITGAFGMGRNASLTLISGLFFGLAMGAGVMIQAVREDGVTKKDATLAIIFLAGCHAVVEDTLIFIPLGIPVLPLLAIRLVVAAVLTVIVGNVWKRTELRKRKETELSL